MIKTEHFEQVEVHSQAELRDWLEANYDQEESVWLVTYKKIVKEKYVSISEVLDELLCFGWIDGLRRKLDEYRTMQLISPRRVHHWTKTYKDRFLVLEQKGKMTDAGRKTMMISVEKGLWDLMDDVDDLQLPSDFKAQLAAYPPALRNFQAFAPSVQRFTLRWIKLAKAEATRSRRMEKAALLARSNQKIPGV